MVLLVTGITAIALASILLGVDKGVRRLSQLHLGLAFLMLVFLIFTGPTLLDYTTTMILAETHITSPDADPE